jgi:hypothetical protein
MTNTNTTTTLNGINIHSGNVLTSTTGTTGGCLVSYVNGGATWTDRSHIDDVKDYIDFALELMNIDLNFERFSRMTNDEKKAMIREMKINKIID